MLCRSPQAFQGPTKLGYLPGYLRIIVLLTIQGNLNPHLLVFVYLCLIHQVILSLFSLLLQVRAIMRRISTQLFFYKQFHTPGSII
jgi:hypothetical protein